MVVVKWVYSSEIARFLAVRPRNVATWVVANRHLKETHSHPSKTKYVFTVFGLIEVEFLAEESVSRTH